MKNANIAIHTDGGARGNPGPAAIGGFISQGNTTLFRFSQFIGNTTNNVAEYSAILHALDWLVSHKPLVSNALQITCHLDSQLVVEQLRGSYKVKSPLLKPLYLRAVDAISAIDSPVSFVHIPREQNAEADLLVNEALDAR